MACHVHLLTHIFNFSLYFMKINSLSLDWNECILRIDIYLSMNTFFVILYKCLQLLERVTYGCKITTPSGYIEELIRYLVTNMWVRLGNSYIVGVIHVLMYTATCSCASRQDEPNPVLWLATWVGKIALSCLLRITCCVPQRNSVLFPYIIMRVNPLLTMKLVWSRWPHFSP